MRIASQFSKVATLVVFLLLSLAFMASAQTTASFEGGPAPLSSGSWSAHDSLIYNGNLHTTAKVTATKAIAVLTGMSNANQVEIVWAPIGDGCDDSGTAYGGIVFMSSASYTGNGYYAYFYSNQIRLYSIVNGAIGVSKGSATAMATMNAGSTFKVLVTTATGKFEYFLNGVSLGSLTDASLSLAGGCYGGALLYGGKSNDIEQMTFTSVIPSTDIIAPSPATIAAGSATSSSIAVTWTAQSDDGGPTGTGAATSYQLRYSTATITEANFAIATPFATGTPKTPGASESYTVTGLSASTKYYFALKIYDEASNASAISNFASATTSASSGGGGGGGSTSGSWNCLGVDDFERAAPGSDWDAPNSVIESGEFAANPARTTWTMATYIKAGANRSAGADSIKLSMTMGAGATLVNSHIPVGFALMLDSPSSSSNGYFLRRANGELVLYTITGNGTSFSGSPVKAPSVARPTPVPGDKITAIIKQSGTTANIYFYINDAFDAQISNITAPAGVWYVGVVQYENGGNNSNIDNYQVCLPNLGSASASKIRKVSGDGQSAPINQYVADSLKVQVTDDAGTPVSNVVIDFQVTQGRGTIETGTFDGKIWKEVESGTLGIPIAKDTLATTASGGHFIKTSYTSGYRGKTAVTIPVYNPEERTYYFYLRYRTKTLNMNGVYVKYSDKDSMLVEVTDVSGNWAWYKHPASFKLAKGLQNIRLVVFEPGWDWDKIALVATNVTGPSGTGMGDTGPNLSNVSNSSGFAAARLKFSSDSDTNVVVSALGYRSDGTTLLTGSPVTFTLDPTPGPAAKVIKDPDLTDPILGTRDEVAGATIIAFVQDEYGNGVPGTQVNWQVLSGVGAALASPSSTTDATGRARVTLTLGLVDTLFQVQGSANGGGGTPLTGSPLIFTIKTGKPPASMAKMSGDNQSGTAGNMLANQLKVKVLGQTGAAYANYPVTFTVKSGDGKVSSASAPTPVSTLKVLTDTNGEAAVYLTLGSKPGVNTVEAKLVGLTSIPTQTFTATSTVGLPTILAIVSGDNQSGAAGLALKDSLVVKVTDSAGNGISGFAVAFELIDGTDAYLDESGLRTRAKYTNASGRAAVSLTMGSSVGEINRVRATATGMTPEIVTFQASATKEVAARIQYFSGNNQDTTVTARLVKPFEVQVFGPFNTNIAGHSVRFRVVKGGGNFDGASEKSVSTDANGIARANLTLGKTAGDSSNVVEAISYRADQPTLLLQGAPVRFWANGKAAPAAKLVKLAATDNQQGANGKELLLPIKAQVADVHGNAITGYPVTFQIEGAGGTFIDDTGETTVKVVQSASDGYATVRWKMPVALGVWRVRVDALRDDGAALTDSPAYFTATAITGDAYKMVKWFTPDTLQGVVDKVVSRKARVRITDQNDLPKGGYMVSFTVTQGAGKVNGQTMVTVPTSADSGIAEVSWLLGTTAGVANNVLEVRTGVIVNPLLVFKATAAPDVPYQLVQDAVANNQLGKVGQVLAKPVKVTIKDKYGNGVPGISVTFHVGGVDSLRGSIGGLVETTLNSDLDGNAQANWTLGKRPGSKNNVMDVTARYNNTNLLNSPATFYGSATVGDPKLLLMASDTSRFVGIIGNQLSELLKARVTDEFKNPIANHSVTFEVMSRTEANGGSLDGTVDVKKIKTTDSNGLVSVQFTLGQNAGNKINRIEARAEYNGIGLTGSPVPFLISAAPSNAYEIVMVAGNEQTGTVGAYLTNELAVMARDRYANPVKGHPIQFRIFVGAADFAALGTDTLLTKVVDTGSDGIARVKWRLGRKAGLDRNTVEASSSNGSTALVNSPIKFTAMANPDITDGVRSKIMAVDAVADANGTSRASIKVTLKDKYENAVTGKYVTLLSDDASSIITQPLSTTDVNGDAIGYVGSTKAGQKLIRARDVNSGVSIAGSVAVTFRALPAYEIARTGVSDGDAQTRNVGTALPLWLRVVVRDMFGNPIANHPVTFMPTQGGGAMLDPQVIYTDSAGTAQARYKLGSSAGVNFVEARAAKADGSGASLNNSPVRFTEVGVKSSPSRLVVVSGDGQTAAPGGQLPNLLKVRLEDINGWPIAGETVKFTVLINNGAIISTNPVTTDMFGEASVQANAGTGAGSTLFSASLPSYTAISAITFTTTTEVTAAQARKLVYLSGGDQRGTVGRTLFNALTVRVEDAYGNPVPNVSVTYLVVDDASIQGKGTLANGGMTMSVLSNAQGQASAAYTLGTRSGLNKIRAAAVNLQPAFVEFLVYGDADYPYCMEKIENPNLHGQVGKRMVYPIQVLVKDQYDNPARGGTVSFVVVPGSGSIDGSFLVTSDANGLASASWILGKQGANEALATASLPCGSPMINFSARGDIQAYPELSLPSEFTISEGQPLCFPITAMDADGDQIYLIASSMPEGATFELNPSNVYNFCWTPTFDQGGQTYYPVFTAQDSKGGIDVDSVKIAVTNENRAPRIVAFEPANEWMKIELHSSRTFSIQAEDPDNDIIYYAWKVNGQSVGSSSTFTFDSRYYQIGTYIISVDVYDAAHTVTHTWGLYTSVEMKSFSCSNVEYQGISLNWQTASENDNIGFNVLRSRSEKGSYEKINTELIASRVDGQYAWIDKDVKSGERYYYKIEDISKSGLATQHGPVSADVPVPKEFELSQNYPNPFNPSTHIRYQMPAAGKVLLQIYNTNGQLIRTLVNGEVQPGFHQVLWDGRNDSDVPVVTGVYYYRIIADGRSMTKKMAMLK